ncbi:MAG: DNA cytosine methyltransferase [Proteobacteria bacterium]|nr:DNA cytosine methyltransferase [Pseudomonadota bacterium]
MNASQPKGYLTKRVGANRGTPRLYFETRQLDTAGFKPGTRYTVDVTQDAVTLKADANGTFTVSRKASGGADVPVIDLNSMSTLAPFAGMEAVKVVFGDNQIQISQLASEKAAASRLQRLQRGVATAALTVAGLAFGAGILDHSAHAGLLSAGLEAKTVMVNEIDADLLEHAGGANPVIQPDTLRIAAPMQEAIQDDELMARVPRADVLVAGIPCSGASRAGKSKHGISMMEHHPEVGHLAHAFLTFVQRVQPGVVLLENVPEYAASASAAIIRQQLRDMGYTTHEVVLNAQDFGSLEARVRWFMVAATKGVTVDLDGLAPTVRPVRTVAEVLDSHDGHRWGTFDYLKAKAVTDKAAGKGFQMQIVTPKDSKVPTLRKGYHKGGSTDPLLQHPTDPDQLRLFSGDEHARIKGVDPELVRGLSNTDKHIALGQGVAPGMVIALMHRVGECLQRAATAAAATTAGYRLDRAVG